MRAIILAAGVGKRLQEKGKESPKCFLEVAGRKLVDRYLDALAECGITDVTYVLGYMADTIENHVKTRAGFNFEFVVNPEFTKGNILSAYVAAHRFDEAFVLMDADVAFPASLLKKLLDSPKADCLLLDADFNNDAEEMKLGADADGRVWEISRNLSKDYPVQGEGVGFFKCSGELGKVFRAELKKHADAGDDRIEYEAVLDETMKLAPIGYEYTDKAPWTEIDFAEDLARANELFQ